MSEEIKDTKLKITFASGAGTVTGANFLIEGNGKKFIIDCGLIQGEKLADDVNWEAFKYPANEIDIIFITHAHIDHIGRLPKVVAEGFNGRIISTIPTKELSAFMLEDTMNILSHDKEHKLSKIYNEENIKKVMSMWEGVEYHQAINVDHGFQFSYKDSGHILGAGMVEVVYNGKKIVFTGDLGNSPAPLLHDTEVINDADYMIMESVYGDRNHEGRETRRDNLAKVINDNFERKGVLVVPMFSLERTQEVLYELNEMSNEGKIPKMPIFLDSPLAIKLTKVYKKYEQYFNDETRAMIAKGDDIFNFPGLHFTQETEDSKAILRTPNPKVIMAGSGMSNGGRIVHHEHNYLSDPNNTILLVGYQSVGTLGRAIADGKKKLHILGEDIPLHAKVVDIHGYSGHKDSAHLLEFVSNSAKTLKKVFVVMGEPKSAMFLAQRIKDNLGITAVTPLAGESVIIDCK